MKKPIHTLIAGLILIGTPIYVSASSTALTNKNFSVNVNGATAENVIRMIAQKAGVQPQFHGDLSKRVTYSFSNTTLEGALNQMASDVGFEFSLNGELLSVTKLGTNSSGSIQPARLIELKFIDADEMALRLKTLLQEGEEVHVDKRLNSLVLIGSEAAYHRAMDFVALFDKLPQQIMIEAKIVETNDRFSRELGFQIGDPTDTSLTNTSLLSTPVVAQDPNLRYKYKVGVLSSRTLEMRLIAAESKGDAKVISRPKVVTINNTKALINSGLTFNVKTLTTATTGGGSESTTTPVTGGLERVEAGLQLDVLPTIVDKTLVRLLVDVNNSEPESTISVDGIPGISTNSANTSIIVENGNTAVIAGLIKQSKTNGRTGIPFLSDIPVLGLLFRSDATSVRNNELVIFITPKILANPSEMDREVAEVKTEKEVAKDDSAEEEEVQAN